MSQLDWLASWGTTHRPGYKWTIFRAQLVDERSIVANDFRVILYPLFPKSSCVTFANTSGNVRACYDKKMIKKAIKFGFPVQIEKNVIKPRPIEHHFDH